MNTVSTLSCHKLSYPCAQQYSDQYKTKEDGKKQNIRGIPSGKVTTPRKSKQDGEVHFNRDLAPRGCKAITANCMRHTPNIEEGFYEQINVALKNRIHFVTCLIDLGSDEGFVIPNVADLVMFSNHHSIPVINYIDESDAAYGNKTPKIVSKHFLTGTKNIIKPTFSIFSTPETHETLYDLKPDALIFAGELANVCVRASLEGFDDNDSLASTYGAEFGAVQYGFPVYTHNDLLIGARDRIQTHNKFYFCFRGKL